MTNIFHERYCDFVQRLFAKRVAGSDGIMHGAIGAAGEAGEIVAAVLLNEAHAVKALDDAKKHWVYDKPLNKMKLIEEMGDQCFYLVALCNLLGVTLADVIEHNMDKLNRRYPQGYTDQAAIDRADTKPVTIDEASHGDGW